MLTRAGLTGTLCLLFGCSSTTSTPDAEVSGPDAVVADAGRPEGYVDPLAGLPQPSGDVLWGVSIPEGCVPKAADREWLRFHCGPKMQIMKRYYVERFPLLKMSVKGNGFRVEPGIDGAGYAWITPKRRGAIYSQMMVFRANAPSGDDTAIRLSRMIP